ncbi:CobW family GTP-binding protein [Aureimonas mangrovi]|uniref:CobW family GTP-binding protein n=1 Tax=Aureimonas mangrovi TaxID=2758041 RepID=UPI00163DDB82|nr:GTP-binding protein [Aureimonas mangrovi]
MTNSKRKPLPATVLTGFLGAGKTTLLRTILATPEGERIGVLVNDFGEINIDAALIVEGTSESISLSNGCVCCTIQTELVTAIRDLVASRPDLDRIVIEASGVSRSLPLADTLLSDELADVVSLDGMFCLVDAASFPELDYATTELAIDQITGADLLILNKVDLVPDDEVERLGGQLAGLMPALRIVTSRYGDVPREILFGPARAERIARGGATGQLPGHRFADHVHGPDCGCGHDHDHGSHTDAFVSCSWETEELLDEAALRAALRKIGRGLLRAKGLLRARSPDGTQTLYEYQQVGKRSRLTAVDLDPGPASIFVAIGPRETMNGAAIDRALDACRAQTVAADAT